MAEDSVAQDHLRDFIERIERMEEEKAAIAADIKEIYAEAKGNGFDTKILRKIITIRKQDANERMEQEALLDMYMAALGMVQAHEAEFNAHFQRGSSGRSAPLAHDRIPFISEPLPAKAAEQAQSCDEAAPTARHDVTTSLLGAEGADDPDQITEPQFDGTVQAGQARASAPEPVESEAADISTPIQPEAANEQPETHGSSPCIAAREADRPATYGQLVTGGESAATNYDAGKPVEALASAAPGCGGGAA